MYHVIFLSEMFGARRVEISAFVLPAFLSTNFSSNVVVGDCLMRLNCSAVILITAWEAVRN